MLLEDMANEIVSFTSELVGGRTINVMNTDGIIVASTEKHRIGSFHQGALEAVKTGKPVAIRADQLPQYPGAKQGYNMPLRVNGSVIGAVGIFGELGADLALTETFLSIGIDELSVSPRSVLPLRQKVRETTVSVVREKVIHDLMSDENAL